MRSKLLVVPALIGCLIIGAASTFWGDDGHRMVGAVAAENLPQDMPAFFRDSGPQLSYLNPEPDRWRDRIERGLDPAMNAAHSPEHYVDFELIDERHLQAPNRLAYLDSLFVTDAGNAGLLHFRILELTQRLRVGFRQWRAEDDPKARRFIEERIINDAGILGHYVADGANPHHTSVHHNGWAEGYSNPRGFTDDNSFHWRFESVFVRSQINLEDIRAVGVEESRSFADLRSAILEYLRESHGQLETLYELEQQESFGETTESGAHAGFAAQRLARAAEMLRDLWWTAWVTSEVDREE